MKLLTLGTNGAQPTDGAHTACYMIPELGIVLDAGSGLYRAPHSMETESLDIYISHAHRDHTLGLAFLFLALMGRVVAELEAPISDANSEYVDERTFESVKRMRIHAVEPTLTEVKDEDYFLMRDAQWLNLEKEGALPGGGIITRFFLEHTCICHGFRLEWPGRSLAYVTDTVANPAASYVDSIRGVDLLLHECYLPDKLAKFATNCGHSVTTPVAQVAAKAEVGRLVLIHNNPLGLDMTGIELTAARNIFPTTEISRDGMEIEF